MADEKTIPEDEAVDFPAATEDPALVAHVAKLEKENGELLRHLADYQNRHNEMQSAMKRQNLDVEQKLKFGHEKFASDVLLALDNLDRAAGAAKQAGDKSPLTVGVIATLAQFGDILKRYGIVPIESLGQPFDPNKHQAVQSTPAGDGQQANTVTMVLQQGYTIHEKVLRPAVVAVAQ